MQIELPSLQRYIGWNQRPSRSDASAVRNFELRPLSAADTAEAKLLVFEGFAGDPVLEWCFDRAEAGYAKRLRAYIELLHRSHTAQGHPVQGAYVGDLLLGLVYVTVPEPPHPGNAEQLESKLKVVCGDQCAARYARYRRVVAQAIPCGRLYRLGFLAVRAAQQARGIGTLLLSWACNLLDADESAAGMVVDTNAKANVSYFQPRGFRELAQVAVSTELLETVLFRARVS